MDQKRRRRRQQNNIKKKNHSHKKYRNKKNKNKKFKKIIAYSLTTIFIVAVILLTLFICSKNISAYHSFDNVTETTTVETTETTETTTQSVSVDIMMIGDMLCHEQVYESGMYPDGTYNYRHLFQNIQTDIDEADIAIVNQETILGGTELGLSGYPMFNSPNQIGDSLVDCGFDIILHATNHALDRSEKGINNTLDFWRSRHPAIAVLGIHTTQEDYDNNNVYIYNKDGFKIAFMNYTYGTNGIPLPHPYSVNLLDEEKFKKDIEYAKENADFTVVCPHWGTEYVHQPDQLEQKWTKIFVDNGVDLVIGTHPHVIQPVEWLENESGHKTLIFYSLGNFVSIQDKIDTMLGGMAKVRVLKENGQVTIDNYEFVPLVTHILWGKGQITTYKLSDYNNELAAQNRINSFQYGMTVEKLNTICQSTLGDYLSSKEAVTETQTQ